MKRIAVLMVACLAVAFLAQAADTPATALGFTVKNIDGKDVDLAKKYDGKVCLIVNVASKCGHTPQYKELEALYKKYKDKGLAILGFPANNFKSQEPGTNDEIKKFCTSTYGVTFDMYSKISVKGDDQAPLYKFLTSKDKDKKFGGDIKWNFTKFLVGKDGKILARFEPETEPNDPKVVKAIEDALNAPAPGGDIWNSLGVGNLSGKQVL